MYKNLGGFFQTIFLYFHPVINLYIEIYCYVCIKL